MSFDGNVLSMWQHIVFVCESNKPDMFCFPALNKSANVLCTCVTGWYMFGVIEHGEVITSLLHSIGACT